MTAILLLPLALSAWHATPIPKKALPALSAEGTGLRIVSHGGAGGYAQFLANPLPLDAPGLIATWTWEVRKFANAHPKPPFSKDADDYPIRVGFLLGNGKDSLRGIRMEGAPKVSHVLLYGATESLPGSRACGPNPHEKKVLNCAMGEAKNIASTRSAALLRDAREGLGIPESELHGMKVVGAWIFADGDDTASETEAVVTQLKLSTSPTKESPSEHSAH